MTRDEMMEKLLDYALGELPDAERAEIAAALGKDEQMAAKLAELRETVGLIAAAKDGGAEKLAPAKRDALLSQIVTGPVAVKRGWWGPAMLAASLAIAIGLSTFSSLALRRDVARVESRLTSSEAERARSEQAYTSALSLLVRRATDLKAEGTALSAKLGDAELKLAAAESSYSVLLAEQEKLQATNTALDDRAKSLVEQLKAEGRLREDAQRIRDTTRAELLASNDRLEKAYRDIAELEKQVVDASRAKNDNEQQLAYLRERVPNIGALGEPARPNHPSAMRPGDDEEQFKALYREGVELYQKGEKARGAEKLEQALRIKVDDRLVLYMRDEMSWKTLEQMLMDSGEARQTALRIMELAKSKATSLTKFRETVAAAKKHLDAISEAEYHLRAITGTGNTEEYGAIVDNPFVRPFDAPLSTFSIDVDTASYANVRRFLNDGKLPPPDAVRLEELVNYFHYAYTPPAGVEPFSVALEAHVAPWEPKHQLVRIGLQAKEIDVREAPPANLVFLVDVSGSMDEPDKLPLVQQSLALLAENLREQDKVGMVVYAGNAGVVLPPTAGSRKDEITTAIQRLQAGGSTNGGQGIEMAYKLAADNFVKGGVNRVILCTDGDFNVGTTSEGDLDRLIEEKRKTGVFLSVLGFGTGNYADARMQSLADKGNGNASYIDSLKEAQKVLVEQATGTLFTIAKDVKIQVEFNPAKVAAYRLVGYENRLLAAQDFNDDRKDAGEIGAGHQVTALYEVIPAGQDVPAANVDELKYQKPAAATAQGAAATELCTVKLRYKKPDGDTSTKIEFALADPGLNAAGASTDFEFAASVAAFAMCLRDSEYKGQANYGLVKELALAGLGDDAKGYRKEFVELVKKASELDEAKKKATGEKK